MPEVLETSPEVLLLRKRRLELMSQKLEIVREFGLLHYRPHPKQDLFHKNGDARRRMVSAGNRFGKSKMGCAEDCAWLLGERVWYPRDSVERTIGIPKRPVKGLVITTDFDKVDEIWTSQGAQPGKLWQMLPRDFVKKANKNQAGVIDDVECANGSRLRFDTVKSWQNNPQSQESSDWDFIHIDEPCPKAMWKASSRGLMDRFGSAWFTLTALKEVWINDMFFPADKRLIVDNEIRDGNKWAIYGSTYDNPFLSREAIKEFEDTLSDEEKQCRIHGLPLELAGLIYKEYNPGKHLLTKLPEGWTNWNQPSKTWTVYYSIDPHPQTPHAVLFVAVSPLGQKIFFAEIFHHCIVGELARLIHATVDPYYVPYVKCDPLAFINDPIKESSSISIELGNHGIFVEKASKDLSTGILKVQQELKKDNNIYFVPTLTRTLWEIQRYVWDEKTNRPVDKDDHMMENMYRLLLDDLRYFDREKITNSNKPIDDMEIPTASHQTSDLDEI